MKKMLAILTALLPAIYVGSLQVSFLLHADDDILFVILGVFSVIGILFPVFFCIFGAKAENKFLAVSNIWFYAGNLLLLAVQIALWIVRYQEVRIAEQNGGMEGGLGLFLLLLLVLPHWISYLFVRIAGAIGCARSLTDVCRARVKALLTGMQLFPITDLISSVIVLRKVNRFLSCQQPPIETK